MSIFTVFGRSVRATSASIRLILLLYGCNLLIAAVTALAFRSVVTTTGTMASLEPLVRDFDFTLVSDFLRFRGDAVNAVMQTGILLAFFSLPLQMVLSAGTLAHVLEGAESFSFRTFMLGCGHFGPRFIRFGAVAILLVGTVVVLAAALAGAVASVMTANALSETTIVGWWAGAAVFVGVVFFISWTITEYARIVIVRTDGRRILSALRIAGGFVWKRLARVMALQLILAGVAVGIMLVYLGVEPALSTTSVAMLVITGCAQQILVLARTWCRVLIFRTELGLHMTDATQEIIGHPESASTFAGA